MIRAFRSVLERVPGATRKSAANALIKIHPFDLSALLELAWDKRQKSTAELGAPGNRSNLPGLGEARLTGASSFPQAPAAGTPQRLLFDAINAASPCLLWDHLIYAYMIENTRIYEIFSRVVSEMLHGEKSGVPTAESQLWLRTTEELFFRDPDRFFLPAVTSRLRSDIHATRRNAYQRMFGMELNHGHADNSPYAYTKAEAFNGEFAGIFEELLREVWVGISNRGNSSGANPTDDAKIIDLADRVHDMLVSRRKHGNLSREEFTFVTMMSWFHMTVEDDLQIVLDLRAETASAEERLFKVAQRVGLPAHGLSKSFFEIADPLSQILILIEQTDFRTANQAGALYLDGGPATALNKIITHWTAITGRDVKARKVAVG